MANKNIQMIKSFLKVMNGDKEAIKAILPDMYVKDIYTIDYNFLKENNLINIIFDVDGTIMPVDDINVIPKLQEFINSLKQKGFNICLMSNGSQKRVSPVAEKLDVKYLADAGKPNPKAYKEALNLLNSTKENTVMVGDQMLTDIKGANDYGLYSILVEPYNNKQNIKTGTSRLLQDIMEKKLSKLKLFTRYNYYKKDVIK